MCNNKASLQWLVATGAAAQLIAKAHSRHVMWQLLILCVAGAAFTGCADQRAAPAEGLPDPATVPNIALVQSRDAIELIGHAKQVVKLRGKEKLYQQSDERERRAILEYLAPRKIDFRRVQAVGDLDEPPTLLPVDQWPKLP